MAQSHKIWSSASTLIDFRISSREGEGTKEGKKEGRKERKKEEREGGQEEGKEEEPWVLGEMKEKRGKKYIYY